MSAGECLTILVLTEDGGGSQETLETLLKKTFLLLVPSTGTHRITFEPQSEREHRIMHGNNWKGRKMNELVDLRRTIATKLLEDEGDVPGFVVFHFDGDRRWSERATGENEALFEERVREPVRQIVRDTLARTAREAELDERLHRLMTWVPFYSIEAWLFRHIDGVRALCCGAAGHHETIEEWRRAPSVLDDVLQPKEALSCIKDKHNTALAKGFRADETLHVSPSYEATVTRMLESKDLLAALVRTAQR